MDGSFAGHALLKKRERPMVVRVQWVKEWMKENKEETQLANGREG